MKEHCPSCQVESVDQIYDLDTGEIGYVCAACGLVVDDGDMASEPELSDDEVNRMLEDAARD